MIFILFFKNVLKMGIKSLSKFLRDSFPELFEIIHISEFSFKKVAIDTSLYLCNFKSLYGEEGWLSAFIKLVACLRENEIHCVFIYDSGYPPEKEEERKERFEARKKTEEKVSRLEFAIEKYKTTGEIENYLLEFSQKRCQSKSMLNSKTFNINQVEFIVKKMRRQLFNISKKDFQTTRELFDILKVPYFNAPLEAETMCADLCKRGLVDAVLTEDTDVLAYATPVFLTKLNTIDGTCIKLNYPDVLKNMEMTTDQFLDFCIMCGTDYNKNIYKVGPAKSQKLIQKYGSIEELKNSTDLDITPLKHIRVRELFKDYTKMDIKVPYCGKPDFQTLEKFIFQKNLTLNIDSLKKSFQQNIVVFE